MKNVQKYPTKNFADSDVKWHGDPAADAAG